VGLGLVLLGAALAGGCDDTSSGNNGSACLQSYECESKRCIANVCRPQPTFNGPASTTTSNQGAPDASTD
jgi:hypothetical protein